jgi:soluble lytic murein transglycosylase-like protein
MAGSLAASAAMHGSAPQVTAVLAASRASLPNILSTSDATHYTAAFSLQEDGNWRGADQHIAAIKDKLLLGSLLAQRYLSASYHTTFAEARSWLLQYGGQPEAHEIWKLAVKRAPRRTTVPKPVKAAAVPVAVSVTAPSSALAPAADANGDDAPLPSEPRQISMTAPPHFQSGLVAWRLGRYSQAAKDFEIVANSSDISGWYVAAGAFWAARAHLLAHEPQAVDSWLELAAQQPRTFYGLIARRMLGMASDVQLGPQPLSKTEQAALTAQPGGRRALALVQIGENDRAETELRALSIHARPGLANAVVALADLAQMPALCEALEPVVTDARRRVDAAYPLPRWKPREGYTVDRALMFALMMQESNFNADAENNSGAAGLMQLMPRTAAAVAKRTGIPFHGVDDLVDPELNLSLGQEYVRQLLAYQDVNGNLILMLAAYNGGMGTMSAMLDKPQYAHDPLLFIESLPKQETRLYVERVLTNMWIYRQRLGQPVTDLDALAANKWPTYVAEDYAQPAQSTPTQSASASSDP